MSRTAIDGLHALLRAPAAASLPASLRASLVQAWEAADADHARRAPWPVIADTLQVLSRLDADASALLAALLFDLPGLRAAVAGELAASHPAVRGLLEGQDAADPVWALHAGREAGRNGEGLRRLLLAIIQDLRVVPILLARQLAKMRVADRLPEAERRALAQLTRDLHAPLANRLGIWQLKWELEDLSFRFLEPDTYKRIARMLDERRVEREQFIVDAVARLKAEVAAIGVKAEVYGRPKHIYSIYNKMRAKRLDFSQIFDVRALRVLVDEVKDCYAVLGIVHQIWTPIPKEFDDYISMPKGNNYQSLHTAVYAADGRSLEVQIRTHGMHKHAELGVAAHWRYKEGGGAPNTEYDEKIALLRSLLSWRDEVTDAADWLEQFKRASLDDTIYVLTPQGRVIDMPRGATAIDFAYRVHTDLGHRCRGPKVIG